MNLQPVGHVIDRRIRSRMINSTLSAEDRRLFSNRRDRDVSVGAARCLDAFIAYNRAAGLGPAPDYTRILADADVLPEHRDAALDDLRLSLMMYETLAGDRAAYSALN